ncbi:uncharacterized protein [Vicugna pacos]|uniref:Uncharacterized protein isoform X4 n=1 Tax=Vicugna pacos TaxID=30538 RepID=A0ABM5BPU0_VICPA
MAESCGLWDCEDPSRWAAVLKRHPEVLRTRAGPRGRLEALDRWYREELPAAIKGRVEKHVTRDDLEQLLAWKLARGLFRPRLQQLVTVNSPELVVQRSAAAFRLLPDMHAAVMELCALQSVGPTTASVPAQPPPTTPGQPRSAGPRRTNLAVAQNLLTCHMTLGCKCLWTAGWQSRRLAAAEAQ